MSNPRPSFKTVSRRKKETRQPKHQTGIVHRSMSSIEPIYYDISNLTNYIGAGATLNLLSTNAQGAGQSQRIGDFVRVLRIIHNFNLYCFNTDVCTTTRIIIFQWIPLTAVFVPLVALISCIPSSSIVHSHFSYQIRVIIVCLWTHPIVRQEKPLPPLELIPIGPNPEIEFGLGVTSGTCHYYVLAISDSSIIPFVERASPMVK